MHPFGGGFSKSREVARLDNEQRTLAHRDEATVARDLIGNGIAKGAAQLGILERVFDAIDLDALA